MLRLPSAATAIARPFIARQRIQLSWQRAQSRQTKIPPRGGYFAWGCFIENLISIKISH
jgi:hypothetical protein